MFLFFRRVALALVLVAFAAQSSELPNQELTPRIMYQLLLGEVAVQRDRLNLSVKTYMELLRTTHDPRIAQRAAEVALYAHQPREAIEAINVWIQYEPHSAEARELLGSIMIGTGQSTDVRETLAHLLAGNKTDVGDDFRTLSVVFAQLTDHAAGLVLAEELAKPYPQLPEAHYLVASAAYLAGNSDRALKAARRALELRPGWEPAALLEARLLQERDPALARAFFLDFLNQYPKARDVRLLYARDLVESKEYVLAREQFNVILESAPDNPDIAFAVALLTIQLKDLASAEPLLQKALDNGFHDQDLVRFYLGQAAEEQKQWARAAQWYGAVAAGEQLNVARIRLALMTAHVSGLQKGLELLQATEDKTPEQKLIKVLANEQMRREAGDFSGAYTVLTEALRSTPDSADLLYERAIVAEKLDKLDAVEQDLRQVIALRPDYAHAYNALGYSFAERAVRLDEALTLIQKALSLSPNDPFILDSLGWVEFRMGQMPESIKSLKQAYSLQEDPEIAAHLGEVLWKSGDQRAARNAWEASLKINPDNEVLRATMHRFVP